MDLKTATLNKALAKGLGASLVADDGIALRIRCVAYPESTSNYADAVLVSNTSLTLSINGAADSTVGTAGVLAFATYTTLGALVDAINLSSNWNAEIVAGLRSDSVSSSQLLARSTATFRMFQKVELKWDSSAATGLDLLLEPGIEFEKQLDSSAVLHRVGFQRAVALVNTSDASATNILVYELKPDKSVVSKTLATFSAADNVEKDTGVDAEVLHADFGNSILIRFRNSGGWVDTGAYLKVTGIRE